MLGAGGGIEGGRVGGGRIEGGGGVRGGSDEAGTGRNGIHGMSKLTIRCAETSVRILARGLGR